MTDDSAVEALAKAIYDACDHAVAWEEADRYFYPIDGKTAHQRYREIARAAMDAARESLAQIADAHYDECRERNDHAGMAAADAIASRIRAREAP